jgi:hypothetical protein
MSAKLSEERKTSEKKLADEKGVIETQYKKKMEDDIAKMKSELAFLQPFSETVFDSSAILTTEA